MLAEAGHCAILSAIETGTRRQGDTGEWRKRGGENPVVDGGFRARIGAARRGKGKRAGR